MNHFPPELQLKAELINGIIVVIFFADWTNVFWICDGYQETEFCHV